MPPREYYEQSEHQFYEFWHRMGSSLGDHQKPFFRLAPVKKGRLLDIGCADGAFLEAARAAGFEPWGIDFDRRSVRYAREKRGLERIEASSLEDFVERIRSQGILFDAVTMFEVLEHQADPRGFLSLATGLLKPGGVLAGSVPNRRRFHMKGSLMERWWHDLPPHHFTRWDPAVMERFLTSQGLRGVAVTTSVFGYVFSTRVRPVTSKLKAVLIGKAAREEGLDLSEVSEMAAFEDVFRQEPLKRWAPGLKLLKSAARAATLVAPIESSYERLAGRGGHLYFQGRKGLKA